MITITAIIRAKPGKEDALRAALLDVARYVDANEPETADFYLSQSSEDETIFTTYERFTDAAAKDRHNNSPATLGFFEVAKDLIEPDVILHTCEEFSSKSGEDTS